MTEPLLSAVGLTRSFSLDARGFRAIDGIDMHIDRGEAVGIVGESGSGKSTLALTLLRAHDPDAGTIRFDGADVTHGGGAALAHMRRRCQLVFQDPRTSLDPRWTVERLVGEPLRIHRAGARAQIRERVRAVLEQVGLSDDALDRRPAAFSGGQRQRIAIARALVSGPDLIVADEPVSALDVSVQAQIVRLFEDIRDTMGTALLLITHDMALLYRLTDRTLVMYFGRVVESGPTDALIERPLHPYTDALIAASPAARRKGKGALLKPVDPPSPIAPPDGCAFHPRCPMARDRCRIEAPLLRDAGAGRSVACHYPLVEAA
jgi:oligopeptide/dipeptide ABC transporter ATP-binding protein